MKKTLLTICTLSLISCSTTPTALKVENGNERSLSCQQLAHEIQIAQRSKADAHKDDKFKITNMFAYWWLYHMMQADKNASQRLELLGNIYRAKEC